MATSVNLDSLPFDIIYQIAMSLDDRDCIHLSRTNRAIHGLMAGELIAHQVVNNHLQHNKEGQLAMALRAGYRKAMGHRFDIHEAIATAAPYSVAVLAHATEFLYWQGFLCYRMGHEVRLLDVHHGGEREHVLNLRNALSPLEPGLDYDDAGQVSLLHYNEGILVLRVHGVRTQDDTLFAIQMVDHAKKVSPGHLLLHKTIPASVPIFVRHTRSYIWYGVMTDQHASRGIWLVRGVDFSTQSTIIFTLDPLVTGDPGDTFCFEMYQENLYVVSTESDFGEDEEYSSFYHWFCYAPRDTRMKGRGRIWRREHREGPINDMWTDISIRTNETTGQPVIVECRREWRDGKSENHRTTYIQPLPPPKKALPKASTQPSSAFAWIESDPKDLAGAHYPYNQRPEKRIRRYYHAEYETNDDPSQRREFMAMRTKHHSYHFSAATFVDLVNDPLPQSGGTTQDRLLLRTVSRKRKCPIDEEGTEGHIGELSRPTQMHPNGIAVEGSEERFVTRGTHIWPSDDAPAELNRLLCPDTRTGSVRAVADERSLLYSVSCSGLPDHHQVLVLISFDPKIRFSTLTSLRTLKAPAVSDPIFPVEVPQPKGESQSLVREAEPLYKAIKWGYWLR